MLRRRGGGVCDLPVFQPDFSFGTVVLSLVLPVVVQSFDVYIQPRSAKTAFVGSSVLKGL